MTEIETSKKKDDYPVYQYPVSIDGSSVNEYDKYDDSEKRAPVYDYDQYELTKEDIILRELNAKYSKKGAYLVLALLAMGFSTTMIVMSQKWVPIEPTTTTTNTTTTTTTTTTTSSTTLPPVDPDQV